MVFRGDLYLIIQYFCRKELIMNYTEARKKASELAEKMTLEEKCSRLRYDSPAVERLGIPAYNWWN